MIRILRADQHRVMPWKNGGGTTTEVAVFPDGAGLDTFLWRVSMASVASDGPFSLFPGIDRTLSILSGNGMALEIDGSEAVVLTTASPPLRFAADVAVSARLVDGPIADLNVMTRREAFEHRVEMVEVDGVLRVEGSGMVLALTEGVSFEGAALGVLDAVMGDAGFEVTGAGRVAVIGLNALPKA